MSHSPPDSSPLAGCTANSQTAGSQTANEFLRRYSLHQKQIYSFIGAFLRSPADIDEVLQETSVVLWRKYPEFRPGADFLRWACGIARFEVYRFCRSRKGVVLPLDDELFQTLADDREAFDEHLDQRRAALATCLRRLKRRDRDLIESCYQLNTTVKSVAEQICRPVNAVYQSLARIRRSLHECVTRNLTTRIP